jgi:hypothetical protein
MTRSFARKISLAAALVLAVLGIVRASLEKFDQQRQAIYVAAQAEQKRLGITNRATLGSQYPTPEISLASAGPACVVPGETAQIVIKGKFKPGTKFLLRSDRLEILTENVTPTEYRATVKVPADIGPEDADLHAFAPVSAFHSAIENAVVVSGRYEWHMNVSNGWRVIARLLEDTRCKSTSGGSMKYQLDFFKGAETTPFEKRTATLYYDPYSNENYHFDIDEADQTGGAQAEMEKIAKRFQDPNLKPEEMEKLTARMEVVQQQLMAEMQKMTDPAYQKQLEQKKLEFGCEDIYLKLTGAQFAGYMRCSEKVGRELKITGTLKFLGK